MYPAIFKEITALDKIRDAAMKVQPVTDYGFARSDLVMPATVDELSILTRDYPVVFTEHEVPVMVTLLGHESHAFIGDDGAWSTQSYIPLVLRTYPFAGIDDEKGELVLCIDSKYPGISTKSGKKLFADSQGTLTPFGLNAANFATTYAGTMKKTHAFARKLKQLDLFMPAEVTVQKNGKSYNFAGLNQVNTEKLAALSGQVLNGMIRSEEMSWIYRHLFSLNNFSNIV